MADSPENKVLGWDDEIQNDGEYSGEESVVLPEGSYDFEVIKTEQAWYDGSTKIPACNMAKVFLRVDGGELGKALCVENIYLLERLSAMNPLRVLRAPLMWLERMFVIEPHAQMVEVALCAFNAAKENNMT